MADLALEDFEKIEIKSEGISESNLEMMYQLAGSYEMLFSKVARKYKELGLKDKTLSEKDMKDYILNEYTFLKRPLIIVDHEIFIGNSKKVVEAAKMAIKRK